MCVCPLGKVGVDNCELGRSVFLCGVKEAFCIPLCLPLWKCYDEPIWQIIPVCPLEQWFPTFDPQMFLDYNLQKSWPAQLVVKASGSFHPRTSEEPRLGATASKILP